jgi:acyl dehydratase
MGIYNNPDRRWEFLGGLDWKLNFPKPVRSGNRLRSKMTILGTRPSSKPGRGVLNSLTEMIDQDGDVVLSLEVVSFLATRPD